MADWLRSFYSYVGRTRRILLLIDNFLAYLLGLEDAPPPANIKVVFFPPNATSIY